MTSIREIEQWTRSGKLILPGDLTLRNLVLHSILYPGRSFDPAVNLSADLDRAASERERELREQQEGRFKAKQKELETLSNDFLKLASRNWFFRSVFDGSVLDVDTQKMKWPGSDLIQCPLEGCDVDFKSPLLLLLREFAEQVVAGQRKGNEVQLNLFLQEKTQASPNLYFFVDCEKLDCGGSRNYSCRVQGGRLKLEQRS